MGTRIELHEKLCKALGSDHVYFQPPPNLEIVYPCIIYKRSGNLMQNADNHPYYYRWQYKVTYITRIAVDDELWPWDPFNFEGEAEAGHSPLSVLLQFPNCSMGMPYTAENLYHYPFTIYY